MGASRGRRVGVIVILIIIIIVVVAGGGYWWLTTQGGDDTAAGDTGGGQAETLPPTPTAVPKLDIVVAALDIPRGKQITENDLTIISWPLIEGVDPPLGVLFVDEEAGITLEQIAVGRFARTDITRGMPLIDQVNVTPDDEPINLVDMGSDAALMVPSGMVALAVPINQLSSVAYALRPGDHIDVMMSFRFVDVDEEFQSMLPNAAMMVTDDFDLVSIGLQSLPFVLGSTERGVFGTTTLVMPSGYSLNSPIANVTGDFIQVPRQATQLVIDNAIVIHVGDWPILDIYQPIVITAIPEELFVQDDPNATAEPNAQAEQPAEGEAPDEPTATTVPFPDVITLAMPRQDALILKYALEIGSDIDYVLRSSQDDALEDIATDPVTLDYIINNRNLPAPVKLPVALDPFVTLLLDFADIRLQNSAPAGGQ